MQVLRATLVLTLAALPVWAHQPEEQKLLPSDGQPGDGIGTSVAIWNDNTVLVGAPMHDVSGNADSGAVYVYVYNGNNWVEQAKLVPLDPSPGDRFGFSVSVNGDTAVIGAPDADTNGADAGAVYVFVRSGTTWTQQAKLVGIQVAADDNFGLSVSVSGDSLVAGAPDVLGSPGAAYVFVRSGTTWTQQARLTASDSIPSNRYGASVAIDVDRAVVGAKGANGLVNGAGAVYVHLRSGTTWSQEAKVVAPDGAAGDEFGTSVAMWSQSIVTVGAPADANLGPNTGSLYDFRRSGSTYTFYHKGIGQDAGDRLGTSVSHAYKTSIAGVPFNDEEGLNAGSSFIYFDQGGGMFGFENMTASDAADDVHLGDAVGASGCWLVSGASGDDVLGLDAGAAYMHVVSYGYAFLQNGSGVNPRCLVTTVPPLVGALWEADVDTSVHPSGAFAQVIMHRKLLANPVLTPWGEGLVNRQSASILNLIVAGIGPVHFLYLIPNDVNLIGVTVYVQGIVRDTNLNILQLCNAEELRIGCRTAPASSPPDHP